MGFRSRGRQGASLGCYNQGVRFGTGCMCRVVSANCVVYGGPQRAQYPLGKEYASSDASNDIMDPYITQGIWLNQWVSGFLGLARASSSTWRFMGTCNPN